MNNNAALLDTLLQQAENAVQRNEQRPSRLTRQAISRRLERTDTENVARQLDEIYQYRVSRLPAAWRVAQQLTLYSKESW